MSTQGFLLSSCIENSHCIQDCGNGLLSPADLEFMKTLYIPLEATASIRRSVWGPTGCVIELSVTQDRQQAQRFFCPRTPHRQAGHRLMKNTSFVPTEHLTVWGMLEWRTYRAIESRRANQRVKNLYYYTGSLQLNKICLACRPGLTGCKIRTSG